MRKLFFELLWITFALLSIPSAFTQTLDSGTIPTVGCSVSQTADGDGIEVRLDVVSITKALIYDSQDKLIWTITTPNAVGYIYIGRKGNPKLPKGKYTLVIGQGDKKSVNEVTFN